MIISRFRIHQKTILSAVQPLLLNWNTPRYLSWRPSGQFYLVSQFSFKESFEGKENRLKTQKMTVIETVHSINL
jgi:hypothetical protein